LFKLKALLDLVRFPCPLIMAAATVLGAVVVCGGLPHYWVLAIGVASTFGLSGASFALNDYADIEIDRVNNPSRPLPSGQLKPGTALRLGVSLSIVGGLLPLLVSLEAALLAAAMWGLSAIYNFGGKRTGFLGNLTIALCASATFLFGALLSGEAVGETIWAIFVLAFTSNAAREVTKGIADAKGDRVEGVKSLAIVHGPRGASVVAALFYGLTAIVGPLIASQLEVSILPLPTAVMLVSEAGFAYCAVSVLVDPGRENALRVNRWSNFWMTLILVAIALNAGLQ